MQPGPKCTTVRDLVSRVRSLKFNKCSGFAALAAADVGDAIDALPASAWASRSDAARHIARGGLGRPEEYWASFLSKHIEASACRMAQPPPAAATEEERAAQSRKHKRSRADDAFDELQRGTNRSRRIAATLERIADKRRGVSAAAINLDNAGDDEMDEVRDCLHAREAELRDREASAGAVADAARADVVRLALAAEAALREARDATDALRGILEADLGRARIASAELELRLAEIAGDGD